MAFQWALWVLNTRGGLKSAGPRCKSPPVSGQFGPTGGTLSSVDDGTDYTFGAGTFSTNVTVTHTPLQGAETLAAGVQVGVRHYYEVSAVNAQGQAVQPAKPYTVTITYSEWDLALSHADEASLALYRKDGTRWVKEPTSRVNLEANTVTATPGRFSTWAVLGRVRPTLLPLVLRGR